jgi:hypothetical protein
MENLFIRIKKYYSNFKYIMYYLNIKKNKFDIVNLFSKSLFIYHKSITSIWLYKAFNL